VNNYLKTVTLGAFTWNNEDRIALLLKHVRKTGRFWLVLHFMLLSFCLAFPVTFAMARLTPFELCSRLYGERFIDALPESARAAFTDINEEDQAGVVNVFNMIMLESGYERDVLLPFLCVTFGLLIVIQAAFYLLSVFFLGMSRLNLPYLSFGDRMGLALFSSTLPAPAAGIFGMYLPAVHILIFYFMVIFFIFQRSGRLKRGDKCLNG
jgi:hypothetical protein